MARRRAGLVAFTVGSLLVNGLLLALLDPTGPSLEVGRIVFGLDGALLGAQAAVRLSAAIAVNVAAFGWLAPAQLLDGLRLPPAWTAFLAAVLIAGQDLGRDFASLRDARRSQGRWPEGRLGSLWAAVAVLPTLMVHAVRRAEVRRDALMLAGFRTGPLFAPVVAVTALGVAGRLALVGLPNVALTYVVVFLGGLVFGVRVGVWAGLWSMVLSNLVLTGLYPGSFANAPAMALLGLLGGLLRPLDLSGPASSSLDRFLGRVLAGGAGFLGTMLFSVTSDLFEWVLAPELRGDVAVLVARVVAGLLFNVVPAILNALVFAASVVPVHAAFRALEVGGAVRQQRDEHGRLVGREGLDGMSTQ